MLSHILLAPTDGTGRYVGAAAGLWIALELWIREPFSSPIGGLRCYGTGLLYDRVQFIDRASSPALIPEVGNLLKYDSVFSQIRSARMQMLFSWAMFLGLD